MVKNVFVLYRHFVIKAAVLFDVLHFWAKSQMFSYVVDCLKHGSINYNFNKWKIIKNNILVNGNIFFHPYISKSIGPWYILSLKTMSSAVTPYPDFKLANSRESFH